MSGSHHAQATGSRLKLALALTAAFVVLEFAVGLWANSLALLADAGHNLTDALALMFSWYAVWIAAKPANPGKTYGYHRVGILAALANASTLIVVAGWIIFEAITRLRAPQMPQSEAMIGVAVVAIGLNAFVALSLHDDGRSDVNIRGAYIHMAGDAVSSLGVVIAGVLVTMLHWAAADPLISLAIAGIIFWSSLGIIRETVNILLEGSPRGLDVDTMVSTVKALQGVQDIHDLHVWTISSGLHALSCHLVIRDEMAGSAAAIVHRVTELLHDRFEIGHTTIQTECLSCEANRTFCALEHVGHEHAH